MSLCWFTFAGNYIDIIYIGACGVHVFQDVVINIVSVFPSDSTHGWILICSVRRGIFVVVVLSVFLVYCVVFLFVYLRSVSSAFNNVILVHICVVIYRKYDNPASFTWCEKLADDWRQTTDAKWWQKLTLTLSSNI
jgi:hypothetical protein